MVSAHGLLLEKVFGQFFVVYKYNSSPILIDLDNGILSGRQINYNGCPKKMNKIGVQFLCVELVKNW